MLRRQEEHVMGRVVTVQWVKGMKVEGAAGPHRLAMDAPPEAGGGDEAPSPAELLLGAIGAWRINNVRRFAERQQWTLRGLRARLTASEAQGQLTGVEGELLVEGTFDDAQIARLQEAAESCRISRALRIPVDVPVRRAEPAA
jgi:putative redox protein